MSADFEIENEDEGPQGAPFWMTTYSDMVTLLLTFFVLIVSMSEIKIQKFQEALSFFQGSTGVLMNKAITGSINQTNPPDPELIRHSEQYERLMAYLEENNLTDKVEVNLTDIGLHVVITDSVMFLSGQADLIEPSRTILRLIAGVMRHHVESVVVEGHTDTQPINTAVYPSNWELSAARASSVIRFLLEQEGALDPSRYLAVGHGEYRPVETNETAAGRARNRRVEILFSWEKWQNEKSPYQSRIRELRPEMNPVK